MPRKKIDATGQLVWVRKGTHMQDAERLIAKNVREVGRGGSGAPTVFVRTFPSGVFTILSADPDWWQEEMEHHRAWGKPQDNTADFLAFLEDVGER